MDIGSIFIGLALLALVAFVVAQPFLENQGVRERPVTQAEALTAEREQVLDALRDLDFDHAMGKLADEDYTPQRARLLARGVELLKQLDAVTAAAPARPGAAEALDDQLERAVAARRKARAGGASSDPEAQMEAAIAARRAPQPAAAAGRACIQCGAGLQANDRFCPKCGAHVAALPACAQCGTPLKSGDRFCGKCGTPAPDAAVTGAA